MLPDDGGGTAPGMAQQWQACLLQPGAHRLYSASVGSPHCCLLLGCHHVSEGAVGSKSRGRGFEKRGCSIIESAVKQLQLWRKTISVQGLC